MAIPKKGVEILEKTIRVREEAEKLLVAGVPDIEKAMTRLIMQRILEMSGGKEGIKLTGANMKRLNKLEQEIKTLIQTPKYQSNIANYLLEFSTLEALNITKQNLINGIKIPKGFFSDIKNEAFKFTENRLLGEGFEQGFVKPLMEEIGSVVLTGGSSGDILTMLEDRLGPHNTSLNRYLENIATDTVNQYNGALDQKVGKVFKLDWLVYFGSIIKTSRPQCKRWVTMKWLHRSQLPREIGWANNNGSGMIPGTTTSNFSINTGGYRCRHDATWITDELVPEGVRASFVRPEPV